MQCYKTIYDLEKWAKWLLKFYSYIILYVKYKMLC